MNKNWMLLSLLLFSLFANAQNLSLELKDGVIRLPQNLAKFIDHEEVNIIDGRYYKIMQFQDIPTQKEKEALEALGIRFLEYIPKNAYIVSIHSELNKTNLYAKNIVSVVDIPKSLRLADDIVNSAYPEWALSEGGVEVVLTMFSDVDYEKYLSTLPSYVSVIDRNEFSKKVHIRLKEEKVTRLFHLLYIRSIDLLPEPGKPEDDLARHMHRSSLISTLYSSGRKYDGRGVIVAVNDDGNVGPHIDFKGRTTQFSADAGGTHGDMVAGILGGAGNLDPKQAGMAKGAEMYIRDYSSSLPGTVTLHQNDKVMIFSSSYSDGCNAGYTSLARQVDQEIRLNTALMQVFSAGNSNGTDCGYGAGDQWGNITGGHKQGKNVIACANLNRDISITGSSSRGPALDGRIKPDISSQGTNQISTDPNNSYALGGGTSAAAPGISGILAQLYQAYRMLNGGIDPSSALMKTCLLNSADDIGNTGPDFIFGWGRVNAYKAVQTIEDNRYFSQSVTQGDMNSHDIIVPSNVKEVKVMVYWHDYEGSTSASTALVNNIDARIVANGNTYLPWLLDHSPSATALNTPATKGIDFLNNMEQISITNPTAGTYTLEVEGSAIAQGPQEYWVTYEFVKDEITLVNPQGGEGYRPNEVVRVFWDAVGSVDNFTFEYSTDNGASWTTVTNTISGDQRFYDWSVPNATNTGQALARISRNGIIGVSDAPFSIIGVPNNIRINRVCPNYMEVSWNSVANADEYGVYLLGQKYMELVGDTSATTYLVPITDPAQEQWVSVAAISTNSFGNIGRRAVAVKHPGGLLNCSQQYDAMITEVVSPNNKSCNTDATRSIEAKFRNVGTDTLFNLPVNYRVNSVSTVSEVINTTILPGQSMVYTFTTPFTFTQNASTTIDIWTSHPNDLSNTNDTMTIDYTFYGVLTTSFIKNFDSENLCDVIIDCEVTQCPLSGGWENVKNQNGDEIDWRVNEGGTASLSTGPSADHTSGNGNYIYLESSGGCNGREAILVSPCVDLSVYSNPRLNFWYHMLGSDMGSLDVEIFDGVNWASLFSISGDQGPQWMEESVDLSAYATSIVKLRFRGRTGTGYMSDLSIDDIVIDSSSPEDMKTAEILSPSTEFCALNTDLDIQVRFENVGVVPVSGMQFSYQINNLPIVTENVSSSVPVNGSVVHTFANSYNFSLNTQYIIKVWTYHPNDLTTYNDTLESKVVLFAPLTSSSENFDNMSLCATDPDCEAVDCDLISDWINLGNKIEDDIDWRVNTGETPSTDVGPSNDHTTGFGNYVYLEASGTCDARTGILESKCIDLSAMTSPFLNYWYHMNGLNMGKLIVEIYDGNVWHLLAMDSVHAGDVWLEKNIDLSAFSSDIVRVRFVGLTGSDYQSDMALDDIKIQSTVGIEDVVSSTSLEVFPNPNKGEFVIRHNGGFKPTSLDLLDVTGRVVMSILIKSNEERVVLNALSKGTYYLRSNDNVYHKLVVME